MVYPVYVTSATAATLLHGEHIRTDSDHRYIIHCRLVLTASRSGRSGGKGGRRGLTEEYFFAGDHGTHHTTNHGRHVVDRLGDDA